MNYRMIKNVLGWLLLFEAGFLLVPLITAVIYSESVFWVYLVTMAVCLAVGALCFIGKPKTRTLYSREGFVIVALSWIVMSLFGALPFYLSGEFPSFIDALFESVSGFTTTGSTILSEVEPLPKSILIWRSFTHWIGGMGVLVFIMAFLPLSGANNMHLMRAESTGPSVGKLVPRVRTTALILYSIYFALSVIQFILLVCGEMDVYEALNATFATAGTGGFGVKNDSLAGYSDYSQIVVTVFLILFSINFNSFYLILCRRFKDAFNSEVKGFFAIVIVFVTIITINVANTFDSVGEALKHSSFTLASIISTAGFATVDFNLWPELSRTVLIIAMFVGACAGSTGGGLKVSRILILFKGMIRELRQLIHPKQVKKITLDGRAVDHEVVRSVNAYIVCYMIMFVTSLVAVSFDNHDLVTNFTAVLATMNNVGPGLNLVGPTQNFGFFSAFSKLVFIFDMLAGRLELFPMLLLFAPSTWRKR